jgi:cobalt/nickel transport system permease protein
MHIAEGAISGSLSGVAVLAGGVALTAAGTGWALARLKEEDIPRTALLSAAFFVASLIHVPVGVINVHLVLNGLLGLVLGWAAFPAILVALWLQAVFFGYGGITTLGINTFSMAAPAVVCHYLVRRWVSAGGLSAACAGFVAGGLGVFLSGLTVAGALVLSAEQFQLAAMLFTGAGVVWAVVEGIVSAATVTALRQFDPNFLQWHSHQDLAEVVVTSEP